MTINPWTLLLGAIVLEVVSTSPLKASQEMTCRGSRCHCRGFADGSNLNR
jgi:hypothetical protein